MCTLPGRTKADTTVRCMTLAWSSAVQVLNSEKEVAKEEGSTKLVNGKYAGDNLYFLLTRWGGKMFTVSESCGRCKFPLTDAKVSDYSTSMSAYKHIHWY